MDEWKLIGKDSPQVLKKSLHLTTNGIKNRRHRLFENFQNQGCVWWRATGNSYDFWGRFCYYNHTISHLKQSSLPIQRNLQLILAFRSYNNKQSNLIAVIILNRSSTYIRSVPVTYVLYPCYISIYQPWTIAVTPALSLSRVATRCTMLNMGTARVRQGLASYHEMCDVYIMWVQTRRS